MQTAVALNNFNTKRFTKPCMSLVIFALALFMCAIAKATVTTPSSWTVTPSGAFEYSLPIRLPPGIAGVQPKVTLQYNSQTGNGIAGVGWSLNALSAITRCPQTFAIDGVRGGVSMDGNDRLCMDGQRLLLKTGTYGAEGAEYVTEQYNGAKIIGTALTGSNARSFKVYTKAGETMEFVPFNNPANNLALQFVLNKVTDAKGNYWQAYYQSDISKGEIYPKAICFTGNVRVNQAPKNCVEFGYGTEANRFGPPALRADPSIAYAGGYAFRNTQKLSGIRTLVDATPNAAGNNWTLSGTVVTEYRLYYRNSQLTDRPLLEKFQECAGNACLPVKILNWNDAQEGKGWKLIADYTPPFNIYKDGIGDLGTRFEDVNGDGLIDMIYSRNNGSSVESGAYINTGNGWLSKPDYAPLFHIQHDINKDLSARFVDVNGDGLTDEIYNRHFSGGIQSGAYINTGSGWVSNPAYTPPFHITANGTGVAIDLSARFVDINGDGLVDEVFHRYHPGGIQAGAYINTGSGWVSNPAHTPPFHITADGIGDLSARFVDVNGDGLVDELFYRIHAGPGGVQAGAYLNTGSGWVNTPAYTPPSNITVDTVGDLGARFVDVNGDGLVDFVHHRLFSGMVQKGAYLNTGKGWISAPEFTPKAPITQDDMGEVGSRFVDVNGDGLVDQVYYRELASGVQKGAYLNTGTGWREDLAYTPPYPFSVDGKGDINTQILDLNGDTKPDIAYHRIKGSTLDKAAYRMDSSMDLMIRINTSDNSMAEDSVQYNYKSRVDAGSTTVPARPAFPKMLVNVPMPLVYGVKSSNVIGGFNTLTFNYGPALAEVGTGRGFLGFAWQESQLKISDGTPTPITRTTYSQTWPCVGMPVQSQVKLPNGGLRSQTDNNLQVRTATSATPVACGAPALNAQSVIPFVNDSVTRTWEVTPANQQGTELPRQKILTTLDAYGNPTRIEEQTLNPDGSPSGYSRITTNTYDTSPEKNRQARLIRSQVTNNQP